ncbi:hypothetical protein [Sphingobacterium kyonggiense]
MNAQLISAAKYYLQYQGLPSTQKRIDKLVSQIGEQAILRMAKERGFADPVISPYN